MDITDALADAVCVNLRAIPDDESTTSIINSAAKLINDLNNDRRELILQRDALLKKLTSSSTRREHPSNKETPASTYPIEVEPDFVILSAEWFTNKTTAHLTAPLGTVGIVKVKCINGEIKHFIGCARGLSEAHEARRIAQWGSTFTSAE